MIKERRKSRHHVSGSAHGATSRRHGSSTQHARPASSSPSVAQATSSRQGSRRHLLGSPRSLYLVKGYYSSASVSVFKGVPRPPSMTSYNSLPLPGIALPLARTGPTVTFWAGERGREASGSLSVFPESQNDPLALTSIPAGPPISPLKK